jgi:RNA polymerase sigma-70 factor (ECF subfamily)
MITWGSSGNTSVVLEAVLKEALGESAGSQDRPEDERPFGGSKLSADAITLTRLIPNAPAPSQAEAKLRRLVDRIKQDDLSAFDELYRCTRDDVSRTLFHLLGARSDLEDLVQETYLRLLKAVKGFRGDSQFKTFLYRVCANVALMHLRWWRRRREELTDEVPDSQALDKDPEACAQDAESIRLVQKALQQLSAKKRIVFVYHELCGMGPEEIATAVDASYNTVRSRLFHARLEFTAAMKKLLEEGA